MTGYKISVASITGSYSRIYAKRAYSVSTPNYSNHETTQVPKDEDMFTTWCVLEWLIFSSV